MRNHTCKAIVITCIDFRFQEIINKWIAQNFKPGTFDRVAFAGGVKNMDVILGQIDIAVRLHHIKKVILINHEDCGAYGETSTPERHEQDLIKAKLMITEKYSEIGVETYYLHLDKTFESIS